MKNQVMFGILALSGLVVSGVSAANRPEAAEEREYSESFRFTVTGDPRNEVSKWEHTLEQITDRVGDEGVFHITAGDYFHHGSITMAADFYESLKNEFGDEVVWYPTVGNHETQDDSTDVEWLRRFYHDHLKGAVNPGPPNGVETLYSFDYQNAHLVQLNQYYDGLTDKHHDGDFRDALYDWLVEDLERNTKPLVFVIYHAPLFPEGRGGKSNDGDPENTERFWKLMEDEMVTAAFCADTHTYGRGRHGNNSFTWEIDVGNAGRQSHADRHQTFLDVIVTGTEVRFDAWQGLEGEAFEITDTWTVNGAEVLHTWTAPQAQPGSDRIVVPEIVLAALSTFAQGGEIDDFIERGEEDGLIIYEAEIKRGEKEIGVTLSETGEILEVEEEEEISWEELPPVARVALDEIDPDNRPGDIKFVTVDGISYYDVGYALKGSGRDVTLSVDGEVFEISQPVRASRLPSAIQEQIAKRFPSATIKEAESKTTTRYEITLQENGNLTEVEAIATGELDEDDDEGEVDNGDVSFAGLPLVVQKTIETHLNGACIENLEQDFEDGRILYEVEARMTDGGEVELKVTPDGTLLKKEVKAPFHPNERTLAEGVMPPSGDTVALWLFDEIDYPHATLTDASEYAMADLCLMEGGNLVVGKFGNALMVSGLDYALCYAGFAGKVSEEDLREPDGTPSALWGPTEGPGALLEGLAGDEWTIEFWLNPEPASGWGSIIEMGQAYNPGFSLSLTRDGFELVNTFAGMKAVCPAAVSAGEWQHVAITRRGSEVQCFVGGERQTSVPEIYPVETEALPDLQKPDDRESEHRDFKPMSFEQRRLSRFNLAIGTDRRSGNRIKGLIDEMRISKVARYDTDFAPTSFSENYGPNAPMAPVANGPALLFDPEADSIPLEFGARKHVFIDDAIIDTRANVQITMNQPFNKQEIGKDFSIRRSSLRGSVFEVEGIVYMALPEGYSSEKGTTYLAISEDGLDFSMKGLIMPETPMYGSFFRDLNPDVPVSEKYKVNAFVSTRGMYFYTSGDGINWRRNEVSQLPLRSGGEGECFWDDQRGRYASYIKRDSSFHNEECTRPGGRVGVGFWTKEILKPWPFHPMNTPYFEGYPFPSVTCEGPTSFGITEAGEVYRIRAIKYPWAPDVYLSFVWRFAPDNDEVRHVDLGISRDGENWSFFGTDWYIPLGSQEEELVLYGLIRRGDEIWQYVDEGGAHGGDGQRVYYRYSQRLDGFVSLDAGVLLGTATTLPLVFEGDQLVLNLNSRGSVRVGLTDENGVAYPGFELGDCDPIVGDHLEKTVAWNGQSSVAALAGKTVRLRFEMQNTKLYAFEIAAHAILDQ